MQVRSPVKTSQIQVLDPNGWNSIEPLKHEARSVMKHAFWKVLMDRPEIPQFINSFLGNGL